MQRSAFTLIELLVVIAIIAILAVVVVLTLNPGQLILQSRDSTRLSDLASLQSAISLYQTDRAINGTVSLGSSSIVYVSLPDPAATSSLGTTCSTMGLPALPPAYTYHCAASSTFRKVDGSGWIPVNLSSITSGAPLGQLPIDPTNASSSRSYLTYTSNGTQYELTSQIESSKYKLGGSNDVASSDAGDSVSLYEKGTNLNLQPLDYGDSSLVGYWTFEEGTGTVAYDYSGNNATGSWSGTQAGTSGYYSAGKMGWAGYFNGSNDQVSVPDAPSLNFGTGNFSISLWYNTADPSWHTMIGKTSSWGGPCGVAAYGIWNYNSTYLAAYVSSPSQCVMSESIPKISSGWAMITIARNGTTVSIYTNGTLYGQPSNAGLSNTNSAAPLMIGAGYQYYAGLLDNARIYNRALSASEIQALYNSQR